MSSMPLWPLMLSFFAPQVTWAGLGQLSKLPLLQQLNCSGVKYLAEHAATTTLPSVISRLTSLILGDTCTLSFVDDSLLELVGKHGVALRQLDCSGCIDISDQGKKLFAESIALTVQCEITSFDHLSATRFLHL